MPTLDRASLARLIDHTLLRADATREEVLRLCAEARRHRFASVCVNSFWVPLVAGELAGSPVKTCAVVGFPLGAMSTAAKCAEAEGALRDGASELDMVINVGCLKGGDPESVRRDIAAVARVCHAGNALLKVIIETALLDDDCKIVACNVAKDAGADFVKTSTGFSTAGATEHDVALMRRTVGPETGVKASGGIRTCDDALRMIDAGANRIGASASVAIVEALPA